MKRLAFTIIILLQYGFILAQQLTARVSATKVEVNQRMALVYNFNGGNLPGDLVPKVNNMLVVAGPSIMQGTNSFNGVTSTTSELTYEILFTKPGTYTIPKVTVKTKKGKFSCNPITINVVKGKNSNAIFPPGYEGKELLIVMEANKKKAFLGEPIAIDLLVYCIFNNVQLNDIKYPTFDGGWTQDATDAFNEKLVTTTYKGKLYNKWTLRRVWMVPSILGKLDFKPVNAAFMCMIEDDNAGVLQFNYNAKSDPVQFEVVALPDTKKPESYINAMGEFTWQVSIDKKSAKANEPIKAKVKITGTGNLPVVEAPILNLPEEFEIFEPKVKNNYKVEIKGINGSKEFEFLIMPRKEGEYTLGPFSFSYFNPITEKYSELLSDSFDIRIAGVIADTTSGAPIVNNGIFKGGRTFKKSDPFFGNPFYYVLLGLPFLLALAFIFFRKKIFFTKKDESIKKLKQAEEKAYKGLAEAKLLLDKGDSHSLASLSTIFFQYISDKFKTTKNEITRANLEKWLPDLQSKVNATKILDQLDQFRFAPAAQSDLNTLYTNIKNFVDELGKK